MQIRRATALVLPMLVAALSACGNSSGSSTAPMDGSAPMDGAAKASGATFTTVYDKVITGYKCLNCHIPGGPGVTTGELDLSTKEKAYANLVSQPAAGTACASTGDLRVKPGNAADSLIVLKTEGSADKTTPPCGAAMPLGCGPDKTPALKCLGDDDLAPLKSWINAGALDN